MSYYTARELCALLRVANGTLYRWAHEDDWSRTKGRPVKYDAFAAQRSKRSRCPHPGPDVVNVSAPSDLPGKRELCNRCGVQIITNHLGERTVIDDTPRREDDVA